MAQIICERCEATTAAGAVLSTIDICPVCRSPFGVATTVGTSHQVRRLRASLGVVQGYLRELGGRGAPRSV